VNETKGTEPSSTRLGPSPRVPPDAFAYMRAIQTSGLPPETRHLLRNLIGYADWPGAVVPAKYTPSLTRQCQDTGYSRSTVAKYLTVAEETGWLARRRPSVAKARAEKARTHYVLMVPDLAGPPHGLVRHTDQG
jgi:hypothetical protein